jgi:hypothetical protein
VSKRLGHSDSAITAKVYAHMLDGRDQVAAEVWEQLNQTALAEEEKGRPQ